MYSQKIINSIQFLRGFAALAVVIHHTGGYVKRYYEPHLLMGDYFGIGFAGVDLFFVISGFIIHFTSKNYLNNPYKLTEYLKKRFVRVFPIFWFVTIFLFLSGWVMKFVFKMDFFSIGYPHTLKAYLETFTLFPLHFAINPVTWTLSYELFFYLCFSLLIISKYLWFIPIGILLISFYNIFIINSGIDLNYYNFVFSGYNFEFMLGYLICQFYDKIQLPNWVMFLLLSVAISIVLYFGYDVSDVDSYQRILIFGVPSGMILFSLLHLEKNGFIKFHHIWIEMGNASYALYLIHFPMMLLMNKIPRIVGYRFNAQQEIIYSYFIIICIVFTSIYVHKWIEKPLSKLILSKI
jgi:exopolysaccharide production protein ExoZ